MRFRGWVLGALKPHCPAGREGEGGAGRGGPTALLPRPAGPGRRLPPAVDSAPTPLLRGGWGVGRVTLLSFRCLGRPLSFRMLIGGVERPRPEGGRGDS